jgi:hypothetical protein
MLVIHNGKEMISKEPPPGEDKFWAATTDDEALLEAFCEALPDTSDTPGTGLDGADEDPTSRCTTKRLIPRTGRSAFPLDAEPRRCFPA